MATSGWVGVDLDGTLAEYKTWLGPTHVGKPVPLMVARVKALLASGVEVRIFTARVWPLPVVWPQDQIAQLVGANDREATARVAAITIRAWCQAHLGQVLPITCTKDMAMIRLFDDRAVTVEKNTGRLLVSVDDLP